MAAIADRFISAPLYPEYVDTEQLDEDADNYVQYGAEPLSKCDFLRLTMLNFQGRNLVTLDPRILHFKDLESLELQGNPGLHPLDSYSNAGLIRCVANLNDKQDDLLIRCYLPKARRFNSTMIETARQARFSDFEKLATAFEALSQKKAFSVTSGNPHPV